MPKRPRFSRWRRLPGVFRTGEHRPTDSGTDLDRIILYIPARILDLAEMLAEKAGVPTVQDYCALLLMRSLENERVKQKVADFEARRGPLEGLKEIADDPSYLAEWQERSDARPDAPAQSQSQGQSQNKPEDGATGPSGLAHNEPVTVDIVARSLDSLPPTFLDDDEDDRSDTDADPRSLPIEADAGIVPIVSLKTTVLKMSDSHAKDVIARHAGWGGDQSGFLPCLRRGEPVPAPRTAELVYALNQLEEELKGSDVIDRRTAHGLHRLALESQVLLTDAWPGVFDDRLITAIRTVQEAVERILSGQDIRYYPPSASGSPSQQAPASERVL